MRDKIDLDIQNLLKDAHLYVKPTTAKEQDILDAAEAMFSEQGVDASRTAEIARRAKVTERTLFKYFSSKHELFRRVLFGGLVRTMLPLQMKRVKSVTQAPYASFRDFALALALDRLETAQSHAPRLRILLLELLQNRSFRTQFIKLWKKHIWVDLLDNVKRFQASGELRADLAPEVVAQVAMTPIITFAFSRYILEIDKPKDPKAELTLLLDTALDGVRARRYN